MMAGGDTDPDGSGGSFEQVRAGVVVERLRARQDELVRGIFARVSGDAFDRAGEDDAEYVAGLRATVVAAVEYVLEGIERGEEGVGQVPAVALEQARRAARAAVPLDTVLRRYVVGSGLLGEFIMEEADRGDLPGEREALRGALRAQASVLERLLAAVTAAYVDELRRAGRSPEQRRYERVKRLLDGGAVEGSELDYELDAWHLGAIATGTGAAQAVSELAAGMDRRLLSVSHGEESVWAWLGGRERFAVGDVERAVSGAMTDEEVGQGVVLALGEPAKGIEGWRLTHQQAQAALVVALRRPRPFTRYADVALLASALKDDALAKALIDIYLAPLEDSRGSGPVLRETLRAYLGAERSVSSAAAKLGVVRKTVENRLRTIEEKIGRTLHPCPAELEVALELDELSGEK
jgi:hypothetical protein